MRKITIEIAGMQCGMCENHVCEALRKAFPAKKVTASRRDGQAVLLTDAPIPHDALRKAVAETGYTVLSIAEEEAGAPRGLLARLFSGRR